MDRGFSGKGNTDDDRHRGVPPGLFFKDVDETVEAGLLRWRPLQIDRQLDPADDIEGVVDDFRWRPFRHRDQEGALGTGFPGMPPLKAAGKDHWRVGGRDFKLVNMPQGPVVISPGLEIGQGAGGVGFMTVTAGQAGMQQADVEIAGYGFRVAEGQVVSDRGCRETLPVYGDFQRIQFACFGGSG